MSKDAMLSVLLETGRLVADRVRQSVQNQTVEQLSSVWKIDAADTIFKIDRDVEEVFVPYLNQEAERLGGIWLIAEGVGEETGGIGLPFGRKQSECKWFLLIDPIDGTRGIMYDKRSAFFLAGAGLNNSSGNSLTDIDVAVMCELPTSKAYLADSYFAIKNEGTKGIRRNMLSGEEFPIMPRPSQSNSVLGGFGVIARFFPPGRDVLARMEDKLIEHLLERYDSPLSISILEDQYISTGGQLHEVLCGHDRFIADIRPLLYQMLAKKGVKPSHVCHPYDCAAMLVGIEAGIVIRDGYGNMLNCPVDVTSPVSWILYANTQIEQQIWPLLKPIMQAEGLLD